MIKSTTYYIILGICLLAACKKYNPAFTRSKPETTLFAGDSRLTNKEIHLSKDTVYILAANLSLDSGRILTIDPGTLIKVNDFLSITIQPGATIQAKGTAAAPIVFTSSAPTGSAGITGGGNGVTGLHTWKGLRIIGNTNTNPTPIPSGTLNYVRIEFAGGAGYMEYIYPFYASLALVNVAKGTSIEHIEVSYSFKAAAIEFAGGDCDARYLLTYASLSADFYLHQGYTGRLQNLLAYRHPYFPDASSIYDINAIAGMYIEDNTTLPTISNLTVLGPDPSQLSTKYNSFRIAAFIALQGAKFHIRNSACFGFPAAGWWLDDNGVATAVSNGQSDFTYSLFHCNDTTKTFYLKPGTYGALTSADFKSYMLQPAFANQQIDDLTAFMLTDPYNYNVYPNPMPKAGSPLLSGANFDAPFNDDFFIKVDYIGAIGIDNWLKDWTNFIPLQTSYND